MPTGIYIRTEKIRERLRHRRIPIRTKEWSENIGNALRKGKYKICRCGKSFFVHRYRLMTAKFCSYKCNGKYGIFGKTKGMKILKGSLAKLGKKNPMFGRVYTEKEKQKQKETMRAYWDKRGRVSKEHKRMIKKILDYKRKAKIKGQFTLNEWEKLKEKYHFTCPACGEKENEMKWNKLTVDHINSLSKGGTNTIENIQPLCLSCNCKKNNKHNTKYEIL